MTHGASALDDPVGRSLRGPHARFARRLGRAVTYLPEATTFSVVSADADASERGDPAESPGPGELADMFSCPVTPPSGWEPVLRLEGRQMTWRGEGRPDHPPVRPGAGVAELTADDAPGMLDLVVRTQPGPFWPQAKRVMPGQGHRASPGTELSVHPGQSHGGLPVEREAVTGRRRTRGGGTRALDREGPRITRRDAIRSGSPLPSTEAGTRRRHASCSRGSRGRDRPGVLDPVRSTAAVPGRLHRTRRRIVAFPQVPEATIRRGSIGQGQLPSRFDPRRPRCRVAGLLGWAVMVRRHAVDHQVRRRVERAVGSPPPDLRRSEPHLGVPGGAAEDDGAVDVAELTVVDAAHLVVVGGAEDLQRVHHALIHDSCAVVVLRRQPADVERLPVRLVVGATGQAGVVGRASLLNDGSRSASGRSPGVPGPCRV